DPLIMFQSNATEKILQKNNITYFKQNTWVDPALKGEDFKKFDLIFISPENYRSFEKPWKEDLDPYLKEVWSYKEGNNKIAVLYSLKV
ncbi:MAG: hypothetical protein QW666_03990, partial [Candidatus Woesearchaeota archaeon]